MTKNETAFEWPDPIPGWDMVKWKDETQAEIYEEIKDMTIKEVLEYFHQASERAACRRMERKLAEKSPL